MKLLVIFALVCTAHAAFAHPVSFKKGVGIMYSGVSISTLVYRLE